MRRLALAAVALAAGCEPDIVGGAYYCGEEQACPPEMRCDGPTATCVYPQNHEPFVCPDGSNAGEPDNDPASAFDLGTAGCGLTVAEPGCIDASSDVDHYAITPGPTCSDPLEIRIRYPIAFTGVVAEVLDADGAVIATGEICDNLDATAQRTTCIDAAVVADGDYVVRVAGDPDIDCDGNCPYTRYQLTIE